MAKQISITVPADTDYHDGFAVAIHIRQVPAAHLTAAAAATVPLPNAYGLPYRARAFPGLQAPSLESLFQTVQTSEMPQRYPTGQKL
jgi:hypothetical protein